MFRLSTMIAAVPLGLVLLLGDIGAPAAGQEPSTAARWFTDRTLVSQHDRPLRFYSDVLEDQVVLINFMFTHCEGVCPLSTQKLRQVQQRLQGRQADRIRLISISVDPQRDTPQQLREFAEHFEAGPDWLFLSGEAADVQFVLGRLGQVVAEPDAHQTLCLLGNVKTGHWVKMQGFSPVEEIADKLMELADEG